MHPALTPLPPVDPRPFPWACEPLEEVAAAEPGDAAAALGFGLSRLIAPHEVGPDAGPERPVVLVTTADWLRERGRPFAQGLAGAGQAGGRLAMSRLIWVRAAKAAEALWALEEALKSGAVAGGLACVPAPSLVVTRRLDFAARAGGAVGILLRASGPADLSAARRRWRIAGQASADRGAAALDATAPGPMRLRAELLRRRDGPPGAWTLEEDDEAGGLRVVAGLAGHGLAANPARPNPFGQDRGGQDRGGQDQGGGERAA